MAKPRGLLLTAETAQEMCDAVDFEDRPGLFENVKMIIRENIQKKVPTHTKIYHGKIACVSLFFLDLTTEILEEYGYTIITTTKDMEIVFSWGDDKYIKRLIKLYK